MRRAWASNNRSRSAPTSTVTSGVRDQVVVPGRVRRRARECTADLASVAAKLLDHLLIELRHRVGHGAVADRRHIACGSRRRTSAAICHRSPDCRSGRARLAPRCRRRQSDKMRLHDGTIHASGIAPHAIEWQLGVRPGAPPFLAYIGDRLRQSDARAPPSPNATSGCSRCAEPGTRRRGATATRL